MHLTTADWSRYVNKREKNNPLLPLAQPQASQLKLLVYDYKPQGFLNIGKH